ncbi:MAG: hypothetical protein E7291_09285 [Lachnospiraceae bacterium]|nr:hypothetical protein [Lachnospiraceae bacterium]
MVGITYGVRQVRIPFRQNLFISLVTLLGTCLSIIVGAALSPLLPVFIGKLAGSGILTFLGIYYIFKFMMASCQKYLLNKKSQPFPTPIITENNRSSSLILRECLSLALALSLNNMGIGFSASIAGLSLVWAAIVTFLCSVIFLLLGNRLGCSPLLQFGQKTADLISGLLLIILGVCEIVFK